jgi:NTP pyrophosphatase (non-canonical NTP hydrolase)
MDQASLKSLTKLAVKFRDERQWKQFHNPKDLAITLTLEAAELLEHMQWKNGQELLQSLEARREEVADELADVLHVVLLLAAEMEIDLGRAFKAKLKKNAMKYPVEKARGTARKYTEL